MPSGTNGKILLTASGKRLISAAGNEACECCGCDPCPAGLASSYTLNLDIDVGAPFNLSGTYAVTLSSVGDCEWYGELASDAGPQSFTMTRVYNTNCAFAIDGFYTGMSSDTDDPTTGTWPDDGVCTNVSVS